jgi:hypothetical protein
MQNGETTFGLALPSADEVTVEAQNDARVADNLALASLAASIAQTGVDDLDRSGGQQVVGGTFETLQAVPEREPLEFQTTSFDDLSNLISAFSFDPTETVLATTSTFNAVPTNLLAPGFTSSIIQQSGSGGGVFGDGSGLFGGTLISF